MYHSHVLSLIYSSINIYWIPFVSYFFMLANGKGDSCLQMSLEPVEVIPTDLDAGGENLKPLLKRQCSHPSLHRKSPAGRTVAFETDFVPFYWLHKASVSQMPWAWTTQLYPPLFYNDHTVSFLTAQYWVSEGRTLQRHRRVSWCLRNFPQDVQGTFHKKANHMVTVQQLELKPPLEMHHTDFVSPGF